MSMNGREVPLDVHGPRGTASGPATSTATSSPDGASRLVSASPAPDRDGALGLDPDRSAARLEPRRTYQVPSVQRAIRISW